MGFAIIISTQHWMLPTGHGKRHSGLEQEVKKRTYPASFSCATQITVYQTVWVHMLHVLGSLTAILPKHDSLTCPAMQLCSLNSTP